VLEFFGALGSIILIDLVLSGDNALVIGAAAAGLPKKQRWYAVVLSGGGAIILRIAFAFAAAPAASSYRRNPALADCHPHPDGQRQYEAYTGSSTGKDDARGQAHCDGGETNHIGFLGSLVHHSRC
jgi:hypothetical protein